jgi:glycosyltransferase involved in cell wall biosynthesis
MKISIITSVCNNQGRIANTIEYVLSQTYPDIEYVVIDGSSTDNTPELIRSFGNRISACVSIPGNGVYDALNKGISIAKYA